LLLLCALFRLPGPGEKKGEFGPQAY
jgi:hypothetical protein